ncbi:ATP-binding protein [Streptomyces sp. NPDC008150]|uniref:ATP-binding protein n=1 Tax=Streptomyces sp. NPDC008150 TaxID=3364816 RepID=UPI0036F0FB7B
MNVPTGQAPAALTRTVDCPRDRRSVRLAREFARAVLGEWGVPQPYDELLLCVSELATNAVLHGVPAGRRFRLGLALRGDGVLRVEVADSGGGEPRLRVAPEAEGGRGLLLVAALADTWGVEPRHPGKTVWCEFRAAEPARTARAAEITVT